ncbi:MAG: DUF1016 family protein [Rickettsiaceae bacterium]|nr:DUF1016 family protein [Rickettsiaceae bacterium]
MKNNKKTPNKDLVRSGDDALSKLYDRVSIHINDAKQRVQSSVNNEMTRAYWLIGQEIVEFEQSGQERAEYGKSTLKELSLRLNKKYKQGFGVVTLQQARKFYLEYQLDSMPRKYQTVSDKSIVISSNLSWSHYVELMTVSRDDARKFYQVEASKNNWSVRELRRQMHSLLFDRLAKSKDKKGLLQLVHQGQEINIPEDAIKDPVVLEFLGIPESNKLVESELEQALINNLQHFLLELGTGFAFVARQKRLTIDNDHFYADLVFYHTILKNYIILDIKTKKLSHADLGQIQLYVNYFDQEIKAPDDNPTIGLVLCTEKSDRMVKYFLGKQSKQIFASKYQLHLPTEEELEVELKREIKEIQHQLKGD